MNKDVFLAILSVDSYNRGYNQGVKGLSDTGGIGTATIIRQSNIADGSTEVAAGFYALAYTVTGVVGIEDGTTVIAYRGTDPSNQAQTIADLWNGWSSFTGVGWASQFGLARTFYGAVTTHDFPSATNLAPANVILTGHSLGGALAGFVGARGGDGIVAAWPRRREPISRPIGLSTFRARQMGPRIRGDDAPMVRMIGLTSRLS